MKELFDHDTLGRLKAGGWKRTLLRHLLLFLAAGICFALLGNLLEAAGLGGSICPAKLFFRVTDRLKDATPDFALWERFALPPQDALIRSYACPFCGMTRAHLAALRLDFGSAFSEHPLFFLGLPYLFLLFHDGLFSKKGRRVKNVLCTVLTLLFALCWLLRLLG